jgi:hypothetical protein
MAYKNFSLGDLQKLSILCAQLSYFSGHLNNLGMQIFTQSNPNSE